ncbi:MAG: zf-TFIIB domain-containing protein [Deltaproteobacteria bacterium]|nr:zf-TFIIB domain-containing protein [Deltaproteobacteria bacterium]
MTVPTPSQTETEYFARIEAEKLKKKADEKRQKLSQAEFEKLKAFHWMRCPKCGMELHAMPYKDVTVDKCFHCQGVYLDEGELEKIAGSESGFMKGFLSLFRS